MRRLPSPAAAGLLLALALTAGGPALLPAQSFEVQQSSGFVEALLPDLGWRQAVVGRQLPPDSLLTSWLASNATFTYGDSTCTVGPLSHLRILAVTDQLARLSLTAGSITVQTSRLPFEIEFRGVTVRIEQGTASISDGVLTLSSGSAVVNGARDAPLAVSPGAVIPLLSRSDGPVFRQDK